jgi:sec-independent protein translocase protein TatA
MLPLAIFGNIGTMEILVLLLIGLLLFGSRLPEVGRSLGRGLMEFKKGLKGMQDQVDEIDRDTDRRVEEEIARRARLAAPSPPAPQPIETTVPRTAEPPSANEAGTPPQPDLAALRYDSRTAGDPAPTHDAQASPHSHPEDELGRS